MGFLTHMIYFLKAHKGEPRALEYASDPNEGISLASRLLRSDTLVLKQGEALYISKKARWKLVVISTLRTIRPV